MARVPKNPSQTDLFVSGKPYGDSFFNEQMALIVQQGLAVVILEWKDAFCPRAIGVRQPNSFEIEEFINGLVTLSQSNLLEPEQTNLVNTRVKRLRRCLVEKEINT